MNIGPHSKNCKKKSNDSKKFAPALAAARKATDDSSERDASLERYVGTYDNVWGRFAIVRWKEGLAVVDLDSRDPFDELPTLEHVEGHIFRRVRHDDDSPGERWLFAVNDESEVLSVTSHSNPSQRVR